MRGKSPTLLLFLLTAALSAFGQDLLSSAFSGWNSSASQKFRPQDLEQLAPNDASILREYGTVAAERRLYSRGTDTLAVTLYRLRDPSSAYGAFSFLRTEEMISADLTEQSAISPRRALALAGNLLLEVSANDVPRLSADVKALIKQLSPHVDTTPYPTLRRYLPAKALMRNSDRYLLGPLALNRLLPLGNGDWLGFADGAEAQLARYSIQGEELTLLLAAYPTPQAAARKLAELGHWFNLNPPSEKDEARPLLFARRTGPLVALVARTSSRGLADSLLEQINYQTRVTWNEPGHRATDPTMAAILVGVFLGTGTILAFAFVSGLAFAGVRLAVKYFLPGKVFDRPETVEILQLGLSGKPIEAKDLY
jgi:hypothetical protein